MQVKREAVFDQWKDSLPDEKIIDPDEIINLHFTGSVGDPAYDFVMSRDGRVQTVSITQVLLDKKNAKMKFFDLLEGNRDERQILLKDRWVLIVNGIQNGMFIVLKKLKFSEQFKQNYAPPIIYL